MCVCIYDVCSAEHSFCVWCVNLHFATVTWASLSEYTEEAQLYLCNYTTGQRGMSV